MPLSPEQKRALEAELVKFVGVPIGEPFVAQDPVNEAMIRHFCEATGDTNPIYLDAEAARAAGHDGIVAPPTMLQAWCMQGFEMAAGYEVPKNNEHRIHKLLTDHGYSGVVATNTDQGYTRYLRPGDRIRATTTIESVSDEKATGLGIGYFIETRTVYTDQDGEEVGWLGFRVLKFIPQQPAAAAGSESGQPAAPSRIKPPMGHDNGPWWNKVNEGVIPIQQCGACSQLYHPPRPMCGKCGAMDMGYVEASGAGTVHTYTVIHYPQFPGYEFPILAALVDLEEGTRLMTNIVECEPGDVYIGMPVQGFVQEGEDGMKLPVFRPVKA